MALLIPLSLRKRVSTDHSAHVTVVLLPLYEKMFGQLHSSLHLCPGGARTDCRKQPLAKRRELQVGNGLSMSAERLRKSRPHWKSTSVF